MLIDAYSKEEETMKDKCDEIELLAVGDPDDDPDPDQSAAEDDPFSLDPLSPLP